MSALEQLDWQVVKDHYDERIDVHQRLAHLHGAALLDDFARLLLGVSDPAANYGAHEHALGPKVLGENNNAAQRLHSLANDFVSLVCASDVPVLIRRAGLKNLAIGVGSEASCMMNPDRCWVANTRSIWAHLLIKHADDHRKANAELKLYREADQTSEMAYAAWAGIHRLLETSMTRISEEGARRATAAGVEPGKLKFLWADAIANQLYLER